MAVNKTGLIGPCIVVEIERDDRVEAAYRRVHPRLWNALFAYCGDYELAGDAEAEAFTQAIRRGDGVRDVDAWVWRTAFRVAGGLLADRNRDVSYDPQSGPGQTASEAFYDQSIVEFVSQLSGLTDQQRAVIVLRYVGQFKPGEIAELLHTTSGSVRVQLHRAHQHLREQMENQHVR